MTLTLCISDLKLHWLLLQLSHLAWHWESIIYFCLLHLKKHLTTFGLLELQPVFEKLIYIVCQSSVDCKALSCGPQKTQNPYCPWCVYPIYTCSASLCPLNWQIPVTEIGLYQRREWMFLSFLSLVFLQIKTTFVFHDWFKNFCAIQSVLLSQSGAWSEQLYTGRLLRFCQFFSGPKCSSTSTAIWLLEVTSCTGILPARFSRFHSVWNPHLESHPMWEPPKKKAHFQPLHFSLCPEQGRFFLRRAWVFSLFSSSYISWY